MIELRAGALVQVTRKASPQFVKPILFRLIRVRTEWITYDGWAWLDGYQIDARGDAVARRSIYVRPAGLQPAPPAPGPAAPPPARRSPPRKADRQVSIDRSLSDRDTR
ncbi:hypothetical protein [Micromonospora sp. S-DT3-3-22]|uniref:hypothetical protein n=1 Tax=Micromonospora sp. S-DT3-3-22 TaxID=2755359 RepID=UPI00188FCEFC